MKLKKTFTLGISALALTFMLQENINKAFANQPGSIRLSSEGTQPSIIIDKSQTVKIAYGSGDKVFFSTSSNHGKSFTPPKPVGQLKDLQLAMTRGVQIASVNDSSVIAATDKHGNVFAWASSNHDKTWGKPVKINDIAGVAGEGFVSVTAGENNNFYALWNDFRDKKGNKLYGATSTNGGKSWSKNYLVYSPPGGSICECCRPSIVAGDKGNIYVFFRNLINGSRDMYLVQSKDAGKTFGKAQKIGQGEWKLKACPMDGGSISVNKGRVDTIWQRQGNLYFTEAGKPDISLGKGNRGTVSFNNKNTFMSWQSGTDIVVKISGHKTPFSFGKGSYPRLAAFNNSPNAILVWETENGIMAAKL
jgi:hypothetical protein